MSYIDSIKDGKLCVKIKGFLFKIVDHCISKKRQEEILKEFNNHIEISEKIEALEAKYIDEKDGFFIEKSTRFYDKKMAEKDKKDSDKKLKKVVNILRLNGSNVIKNDEAIRRITLVVLDKKGV